MIKRYSTSRKMRKARIRSKISGTEMRPRLSIFRSNTGIYAQIIDDVKMCTITSSSHLEIKAKGTKSEIAMSVGSDLASKALKSGVKAVVFDRGGFKYHGRIKALADAAREGGLEF